MAFNTLTECTRIQQVRKIEQEQLVRESRVECGSFLAAAMVLFIHRILRHRQPTATRSKSDYSAVKHCGQVMYYKNLQDCPESR